MDGVTHKLIYELKLFNFINMGQHSLSYSNTPPHVWATNNVQHVHTISIKRGRWQIKIEQPGFDTMLKNHLNQKFKLMV